MAPRSTQPKTKLQIHPVPFKPTLLSIPQSPFSPREPKTPGSPQTTELRNNSSAYPTPDPSHATPASPLKWVWQCHQCHRTYALSVTRRCLEDGHLFCAGTTTVKNWRSGQNQWRVKEHRACGSEFDYEGWKGWGRWRRSGRGSLRKDSIYDSDSDSDSDTYYTESSGSDEGLSDAERNGWSPMGINRLNMEQKKDCWNTCDYPSECRWGKQYGVHTPSTSPPPPASNDTFEDILKSSNVSEKEKRKKKKTEKGDFWSSLVASAARRMSVPPLSPLANEPEESKLELESPKSKRDDREYVEMSSAPPQPFVNPQHLSSTMAESTTASVPKVSLRDMIKKTSKCNCFSKTVEAESLESIPRASARVHTVAETSLGFESREDLSLEGFATLERTRSRDSGYVSTPSPEMDL